MTGAEIRARLLLVGLSVVLLGVRAQGQGWSVDLSAGRTVYDPVSVNVGANNVMGTLRFDALSGAWVYGTAAAPTHSGDPVWGAFGGGGRVAQPGAPRRRVSVGADLGAHGFLFRDTIANQAGRGGTVEAMPFARLAAGSAGIEMRGGWRGQTLSFAGVTDKRGVFETGARGVWDGPVRAQADVNWVHASEGTFPFVGGSIAYGGSPVQLWAQMGKWLSEQLNEASWGAGASVAVGSQMTLWAAVRQEAPDPLYWNAARRTWSVGITRRLGRGAPVLQAVPRAESGDVVIRVRAADARGESLFIAGDFNNWQPVPMRREGGAWVIQLPLAPGVYNYAFRSDRGEWFVPASVASRRDDGMGGHVAVLVVG